MSDSWGNGDTAIDSSADDGFGGGDAFGGDSTSDFGAPAQEEPEFDPTSLRPLRDFEFDFATFGVKIIDCNAEEAWKLMKLAATSSEVDVTMFKQAFVNYVYALYRAGIQTSAAEIEMMIRADNWKVFLIAIARPLNNYSYTVVGLDGAPGLLHALTFQTQPVTSSKKLQDYWPKSPEENLELLKISGFTVASSAKVCRGCGAVGHSKRDCKTNSEPPAKLIPECVYCKVERPDEATDHHARDCPHPRPHTGPKPKECRVCQSTEHIAQDCPEKVIQTCRICESPDHRAADCPDKVIRTCHNCGAEDHMSKDCSEPRKERDMSAVACFNCGEAGHSRRDCTRRTDYSKVVCKNCGGNDHSAARCLLPAKKLEPKGEHLTEEIADISVSAPEKETPANGGEGGIPDGW